MTVLIDTREVRPHERFEFWTAASCWVLHPMRIKQTQERPFWGRISTHSLGATSMFHLEGDASLVRRTTSTIKDLDPEWFDFGFQLRGRSLIEQDERSSVIGPGDLWALQSSRPWIFEALTPFEVVFFAIPRSLLQPHTERICSQTALRVGGTEGLGDAARPFVSRLISGLNGGSIHGSPALGECVVDLARSIFLERGDASEASRTLSAPEFLPRIKSFIETRLADPGLHPEAIARAHFISSRYLYKLFEAEGTGVSEWIRWKRLDRCRQDLLDPTLVHESIRTIASRWCFTNPAHFSRRFREAYGCSPRELRARANGSSDGEVDSGYSQRPGLLGILSNRRKNPTGDDATNA